MLLFELPVEISDFRSSDSGFDTSDRKLDGEGGKDSMFSVSGEDGSDRGSAPIPKDASRRGIFSVKRLSRTSKPDRSKSTTVGPSTLFTPESDEDGCAVKTRFCKRKIMSSSWFGTRRIPGFILVKTGGSSATVVFLAASLERSSAEMSDGAESEFVSSTGFAGQFSFSCLPSFSGSGVSTSRLICDCRVWLREEFRGKSLSLSCEISSLSISLSLVKSIIFILFSCPCCCVIFSSFVGPGMFVSLFTGISCKVLFRIFWQNVSSTSSKSKSLL